MVRFRAATAWLGAALVVAVGLGVGGYLWATSDDLPDNAVLAVGDEVVTENEFAERVDTLRALYGVQPQQPDNRDQFRRTAAKAIAVSIILRNRARERGITVSDSRASAALDKYITAQIGPGRHARATFTELMADVGTSRTVVLDEIKRRIAVRELFVKVTKDVSVTEQEVRAAFGRYRDDLGAPERRRIRNIVVQSKQRALDIINRLRSGATFAELARTYSLDGATRDKGGDLGFVTAARLQDEYARVAFSTPVGEVFGPVHNEFGWNVGKVVEVQPAVPARYRQVKDALRKRVIADQRFDRWREWLSRAIAGADVRYADEYRPANPDSPGSAPVAPLPRLGENPPR